MIAGRFTRTARRRLSRRCVLAFVLLLIASPAVVRAQTPENKCDTARRLMGNALRRLEPGVAAAALGEASQNLRRATELCPGLGDAYYFLSLIAVESRDAPRADLWRRKAEFYGSAAMRDDQPLYGAQVSAPAPAASARLAGDDVSAAPPIVAPLPVVRVSPIVRRKLALVVGISRFKDSRINSLKYTSRDAEAVAIALQRDCQFDYVKTLLDEEATSYNIKTEIERLAKMADANDLVALYVSSHGSPENLDTAGVNYIVTHDTEVNNLYPTAYRMDDLLDDIDLRIKAARVIAFLDTCYSGGTFRQLPSGWAASSRSIAGTGGVSVPWLQERLRRGARALAVESDGGASAAAQGRVEQGIGRVIITSSSQTEQSWEDDTIKHGYFTYYLLDALKQQGPVSVEDVFANLRTKVPESVRRDKQESQHPAIARTRERVNVYLKDRAHPGPAPAKR